MEDKTTERGVKGLTLRYWKDYQVQGCSNYSKSHAGKSELGAQILKNVKYNRKRGGGVDDMRFKVHCFYGEGK